MSLVLDSNYTERAIAVFGDTKLYAKKLGEMKGKFNMGLTYRLDKSLIKMTRTDGKEPGWVFPKTMLSVVEAFVRNPPKVTEEKTEESKTKESKVTEDNDKIMLSREQFMNLVSTVNRLEQEVALLKNKVLGSSSSVVKVEADKSEKVSNVRKQPKKVVEEISDDEEEEELMEYTSNQKGPSLLRR
jgi:septal ring factor EnvC (AmiA/AmiB activator)